MLKVLAKILLLTVWLSCMGWVIRFEAYPHWFDGTVHGYEALSRDLPAMRDSWMKVMSSGMHVGYLNSTIEMEESGGQENLLLSTQLMLRVKFQGRREMLRLTNDVRLNARHELLSSSSGFSLGPLEGDLLLSPRASAEGFDLSIEINDMKFSRVLDLPEEAIIASPMLDQGLRSVKPGQVMRIRTLDPLSFSGDLQTVEVRGVSSEQRFVVGENRPVEVTRLETRFGDLVLESEVDEYGRVLWQQTPFGLEFVHSRAQNAMTIPPGNVLDPAQLFSSKVFSTMLSSPAIP